MPALVPRQVLFGNPERTSPRISPDGTRLAWIAPDRGVLNVWVAPVGDMGAGTPVTDDRDRGIRSFFWAHDGRHLLYIQDKGGDENWRLFAVDLIDGGTSDLTPFDGVQAQVVAVDKRFPHELLVALNKDNPQLHDVYHLDLRTGTLTRRAANPGFVGWVVDAEFAVRGAVAPTPDGGMQILVRDAAAAGEAGDTAAGAAAGSGDEAGDGGWRLLLDVPFEDALTSAPIEFNGSGHGLYLVSSVGANAGRLMVADVASGASQVLAEDPVYDVAGVRLHPDTREVQLVAFLKDRMELTVLDPTIESEIAALQALHAGELSLQGQDDADANWLVGYVVDDGPIAYYSWDRRSQNATFLFHHQPALADYELAGMEPFELTARDGLTLHGYLTFPRGVARRDLPAVLNVHGGPWARDAWGFNAEAQWLANRGYLCIQVNYRGSTGYGKRFVNAGDKQWGAAMHDDLLDTIAWVVEHGYADKERIGIYGGSYGGYAALVGVTFTPDVFRCAVDIVGPSNLKTLIETVPPYWAPMIMQFHTRVGDPETEEDFLWSRSPLSKVDNIKVPLLIAQGANDPRVKRSESEQIVAALRQRGIDHEYLVFEDEGHGFAKPENRLRFYAAAEAFLARHLGGRAEP